MHPLELWGQKLRIAILYVTSTETELKTVYSIYFLSIRWWSYGLRETVISLRDMQYQLFPQGSETGLYTHLALYQHRVNRDIHLQDYEKSLNIFQIQFARNYSLN